MYGKLRLKNQLCYRLYTASRLFTQAYEPHLRPLGITYTQLLVLMVLWEKDEQPVNKIGERLLLGINTTSPLIKRMEGMGLLSRHDSEDDKRKQIVFLTEKGKALKDKAKNLPDLVMKDVEATGMARETIEALVPALDEMIEKMGNKKK